MIVQVGESGVLRAILKMLDLIEADGSINTLVERIELQLSGQEQPTILYSTSDTPTQLPT